MTTITIQKYSSKAILSVRAHSSKGRALNFETENLSALLDSLEATIPDFKRKITEDNLNNENSCNLQSELSNLHEEGLFHLLSEIQTADIKI